MSIPIIRTYFESKLKTWATSKSPKIKVSYQGGNFPKPPADLWIQCFLIPTATLNREVGATKETHLGLFQIEVWSAHGKGMVAAEAMAEELRALFPVVPKESVSIEKPPSIGRAQHDNSGWNITPILINYRYET